MDTFTDDEKARLVQIVKAYPDNPRKAFVAIKEAVGLDRVEAAIRYLETALQ